MKDRLPPDIKIGDRVPLPNRPAPRPAWTGPGSPSFKPGRNGGKAFK